MTKRNQDKQRSTKHYTENKRSSNTTPLKTGGEIGCPGRVSIIPAPLEIVHLALNNNNSLTFSLIISEILVLLLVIIGAIFNLS